MTDSLDRLKTALADRYTIEREIGSGGMATVYLAEDLKHERRVAVKVLRPELAAALGAERFHREIKIAAKLHHPHILPLHDSGEADGFLYYVMPYEEGQSLREKLAKERELPIAEAVQVLRDVVEALGHAHRNDVVHRDIKPDNVMLSDRHALVTDFGVAKAVSEATGTEQLTTAGIALGTPAYMAPEQAAADPLIDHRADIYAVGAVAYELLTGRPPFTGNTQQEVLAAHVTQAPDPVTKYRDSVPPALEQLVMKCLAKRPADRWQNAEELLPQLEALATPSGGVTPTAGAAPAEPSMKARGMAFALLAAIVVVAGGVWWTMGDRSDVLPSASRIAIVPFAPATPDTALTRLGHDLVVLLSANLDGVGDLATVDASAIVGHSLLREEPYTLEEAVELGQRFAAARVVHGSLVRVGDSVRVDAVLVATDDLDPIARLSKTAPEHDVVSLADSLTWTLLEQVWRGQGNPSPFLVSNMTSSIEALRAFLEGARAESDALYRNAAAAYQRAIDADSTFWLAYWRYSSAQSWMLLPVPAEYIEAYWQHRDELPERARVLIEANRVMPRSARLAALREVTRRYPDYVPAWYNYADLIFHTGGFFGRPMEEAVEGFEELVRLNPTTVTGLEHLAGAYVMLGDSAKSAWALEKLEANRGREKLAAQFGVDRELDLCHKIHFEGVDWRQHIDTSDAFFEQVRNMNFPAQLVRGALSQGLCGLPQAGMFLNRVALRKNIPQSYKRIGQRALTYLWAARGAWDSALVALDDYGMMVSSDSAAIDAYRIASLGAFVDAFESVTATQRRGAALEAAATAEDSAEVFWLTGVNAVTVGDMETVRASRERLERLGARNAEHLVRGLSALELERQGSRQLAMEDLRGLLIATGDSLVQRRYPSFDPIVRMQLSQWHLEAGEYEEAVDPLLWIESGVTGAAVREMQSAVESLVHLQRARAEEARGRADRAAFYYRRFLQAYDTPVERHRHLVEEAEAALARLEGVTEAGER